jgi:hypothetical protein
LATKVAALEREVTRYKARAERAEALVELQLPRDLGGDDAKRFQSLCVLVQGCLGG